MANYMDTDDYKHKHYLTLSTVFSVFKTKHFEKMDLFY